MQEVRQAESRMSRQEGRREGGKIKKKGKEVKNCGRKGERKYCVRERTFTKE